MQHRPTVLYHGPAATALAERWNDLDRPFELVGGDLESSPQTVDASVDVAVVEPASDGGRDATALIDRVHERANSIPVVVVNRGVVPDVDSVLPDGAWTQVTVPADADRVALLSELASVVSDLATQRRERSMFESLLENAPVSVYFKDRDGRHVAVSDAMIDMIGEPVIENEEGKRHHHPDDVVGKSDFDLYADDLAAETVADDTRVMESEDPIGNRVEHSWGERGHGTYVATSKAPWYDGEGSVRGLVGITRDISERKRYEYQLERQNDRLRRFTTMVSHDIRNPLSVAMGRLEVAEATGDPEHFRAIENSLDRIDQLVGDMIHVMRQAESVMDPERVSLSAAARRVWSGVDTGDATLEAPTVATIFADDGRLKLLLETLFANAVEHGPAPGRTEPLTVTVGDLTDGDGFYVADDGVGIPADRREEVFEPGLSAADGSDIGLSLVAAIADAHNWAIRVVESDSGGARFEFRGVRQLG